MIKVNLNSIKQWSKAYKQEIKATWVAVLIFLVCLTAFLQLSQPKFVTFSLQKSVQTFTQQLAKKDISLEERNLFTARFVKLLDEDTKDYAKAHHAVILVRGAVVAGSLPDITQEIQLEVAKQLSAELGQEVPNK